MGDGRRDVNDQKDNGLSLDAQQQLNQRLQEQNPHPGRAGYGGVAPLANDAVNGTPNKNGARDPFFQGDPARQPNGGRAGYGADGFPGGQRTNQTPDGTGEQVPNFRDHHRDKARDPNQPYDRSDVGKQVSEQIRGGGAGSGWKLAFEGGDYFNPKAQKAIDDRGQKGVLRDTTPVTNAIFAGGAGIATPWMLNGLNKGADKLAANHPEGKVGDLARSWQRNFNPEFQNAGDLLKNTPKHAEAFNSFEALKTNLAKTAEGTDEAALAAKEKLNFLNQRAGNFGTVQEAEAKVFGQNTARAFTQEELGIINKRVIAGEAQEAAAKVNASKLAQLAENSPGFLKRAGAGIVGAGGSFTGVWLDRQINAATHKNQNDSWNLSQIAAPMAFALTPGGLIKRTAAAAIGGAVTSQVFDRGLSAIGITAPDRINAATGVYDGWNAASTAASLGIAAFTKNPWAKVAVVAAGQALPFAVHAYQDNIGGNLKGRTEDVRDAIKADHSERTMSSLNRVTDDLKSVLAKKEDWVVDSADTNFNALRSSRPMPGQPAGRWESLTPEQKLMGLRDDVAGAGAIADHVLSKGTRLADKGSEPTYILGDTKMDIGTRGLYYLMRSRDSAQSAKAMTDALIQNNGTVDGKVPKQSESEDLGKVIEQRNERINEILTSKQDVKKAFDELVDNAKVIDKTFLKTFIQGQDRILQEYSQRRAEAQRRYESANQSGDTDLQRRAEARIFEYNQVLAKVHRDKALVYMAMAKAKMNGGNDGGGAEDYLIDDGKNQLDIYQNTGQRKGYNGAQGALRLAEKYYPDNPNMAGLNDIFKDLAQEMVDKKRIQLTSTSTNILGYQDGFAKPGR